MKWTLSLFFLHPKRGFQVLVLYKTRMSLPPAGDAGISDRQRSNHSTSISGRGFLLELQNVKFGYDSKRPVLKGVSLTVERGQV